MGTDIHAVFQVQRDGRWHDVASEWEQWRNYELFAWLGNVRNGFGFAGVETFVPIEPLSDNRGLPLDFERCPDDDMSHPMSLEAFDPQRRKYLGNEDKLDDDRHLMWMGDHSHSWLFLDEILDAEPPVIRHRGVVDRKWYETWDGISAPTSWSGMINGLDIIVARRIENKTRPLEPEVTHVQIEFVTAAGFDDFIEHVRKVRLEHGANTRLVFGFDS